MRICTQTPSGEFYHGTAPESAVPVSRLTTFNNQTYMSNDAPAVLESRTGILTGPESILKQCIRHDIYAAKRKEATL